VPTPELLLPWHALYGVIRAAVDCAKCGTERFCGDPRNIIFEKYGIVRQWIYLPPGACFSKLSHFSDIEEASVLQEHRQNLHRL